MLANLRLTINTFSLSSTDLFLKVISILQLTVKICQILRHTAKLLVVLRITVKPIETLHEFRILFCDKGFEGKLPNYLIFPTPRGYPVNFRSLYQGYAGGGGGEEKWTMMTLEHTDELQEIWYPCMYVLPQNYKL